MNIRKHIGFAALVAGLSLSSSAYSAVIDFESFSAGDFVPNGTTISGAEFSVSGQGTTGGDDRVLMIFDSGNPTGGDNDLFNKTAGNILIISEDNDQSDPDDSRFGGLITIDFDVPVLDLSIMTIDVGDNSNQNNGDSFASAFFQGTQVGQFDFLSGQGNNNLQTATFATSGPFDQLQINLDSSGAIAEIAFTPVPVPAALPLFLTGIAGLAVFTCKRKRRSSS